MRNFTLQKNVLLLLCAFLIAPLLRAQTYNGDLSLTSQAEVNTFNYTSITGYLHIGGNDIIQIDALSVLTSVGGYLSIYDNIALTNIDGLSALTSVGGNMTISANSILTNYDGLSTLTSVGGNLSIGSNAILTNIDGLSALTSVGGNIFINGAILTNIDGLSALTSVGGDLSFFGTILTNIDGLSALTSVGGDLSFFENANLLSIDGLSALTSVGEDIGFYENANLTNIDGLSALTSVGGNISFFENANLLEFCGLYALLNGGGLSGSLSMYYNAANPTQQEIINAGSCSFLITWDGSTNTDWNTGGNWDGGIVPSSLYSVIVPDETNDPVIGATGTASCKDLTVETGAVLTIQSTASGTGSLIVAGSASGNIVAKRYVTADYWHYISSPVAGQALNGDWMSNNNIVNTPPYQFFRWDEDSEYWIQYGYTGSEPEDFADATFIEARGYAAVRSSSDALDFVGTVRTSTVNYPVAIGGSGNHLIGNPFTSSIAITDDAQATNNFLAHNANILHNSYQAIYIWDESAGYNYGDNDYKVICNTDFTGQGSESTIDQDFVQPGQAFMVKVKQAGNITFNANIRKHGTADFYKSKESWPGVELRIANGDHSNSTIIAFNNNMTDGLDPSYDVAKLKGNPDLALYTDLVESTGKDYAVQVLPNQSIQEYIIPVGVDVADNGVFEFSLYQQNLDSYNIVLEDRQENAFTNLRWDTYFATVSESGSGRFYLHFKDATGVENLTPQNNIQIFAADDHIIIKGAAKGDVSVSDVMGRIVLQQNISGGELISFPVNLQAGVYIVSIKSGNEIKAEKVFIK